MRVSLARHYKLVVFFIIIFRSRCFFVVHSFSIIAEAFVCVCVFTCLHVIYSVCICLRLNHDYNGRTKLSWQPWKWIQERFLFYLYYYRVVAYFDSATPSAATHSFIIRSITPWCSGFGFLFLLYLIFGRLCTQVYASPKKSNFFFLCK